MSASESAFAPVQRWSSPTSSHLVVRARLAAVVASMWVEKPPTS